MAKETLNFTNDELEGSENISRKAAGLDVILPEVWKKRKFNDIFLQSCNAMYNQNIMEKMNERLHPVLSKVK